MIGKKKIVAAVSTCVLGGAGALFVAAPAHAAQYYLEICNSANSRGPIMVYSSNWPGGNTLITGACKTYGDINSIDYDPDPELGADVGRTYWGLEGQGLTHCVPGELRLNPPNDTGGKYVKVNTDATTTCP